MAEMYRQACMMRIFGIQTQSIAYDITYLMTVCIYAD